MLFRSDDFTGKATNDFTMRNVKEAFTEGEYVSLVARSVGVAATATLICLALALPAAFYI